MMEQKQQIRRMSSMNIPNSKKAVTKRGLDQSKLFGDHFKQLDMGTRAATIDVAVPFINAMKKSHHDFMLRCKIEINTSAEQRMQTEMLPHPKIKDSTPPVYLLANKDLSATMHQSLLKLKEYTQSHEALLYIMSKEKEELFLCPNFIHSPSHRVNFKIDPVTTLATYVAKTGNYVKCDDVLKDARFPLGLGYLGICNQAALGVPVKSSSGELIAVMELSKKTNQPPYKKKDELAALCLAKWMGSSIGITIEIRQFLNRHQFFNYIKHIIIYYSSSGDFPFENVLTHLMAFSEQYFHASKGRLYVLMKVEEDGKLVPQLQMFAQPESGIIFVKTNTQSLGVSNSVAQNVIRDTQALNLAGCEVNEYEQWFDDDRISSILCEPIIGKRSKSIGAIEFFNKFNGNKFTEDDQSLLTVLAKYLTVLLKYYKLASRKKKLKAKIGLYTEMLASHIKPSSSVMEKFKEPVEIPHDLFTYGFFPKIWTIEYLANLCLVMVDEVLGSCHFPDLDLGVFLITLVKAHNSSPPFTNFLHTFTVFHCVCVILMENRGYYSKPQQEYLVMAALFHCFGISKLSLKYSKGFELTSFSSHYTNNFFKIFKLMDKVRSFWVHMLIKAGAERNEKRYHSKLCSIILKDELDWNDDIHRFYSMALLIRVAEDAMWYKPFQFTAYMSKNLLIQMRQEQAELEEKLRVHKNKKTVKCKKRISGKEFVAQQINDIRTKCLPNIEILGFILPGVQPLLNYACSTVKQWELIMKGDDCWIWEPELSWPKTTPMEKEFYFSPVDYFIKESL